MKNKIKYILAGCCLMTTFSCSDFLERYPLDKAVNDTSVSYTHLTLPTT